MIVATSSVGLAHLTLHIARKNITHKGVLAAAIEAPGIVLARPQVHMVKFFNSLIFKQGKSQFCLAIFVPEEQPERVFGIVGAATVATSNSQARIYLEAFAAVRVNQLNRGRPFPVSPILICVDINTGRLVKQVVQVRHQ